MIRSINEALAVLGLDADSSPATVAHAYRRLARATHPDVSPTPDAAQRFATICAAYHLLRDAPARADAAFGQHRAGSESVPDDPGSPQRPVDTAIVRPTFSMSPSTSVFAGPVFIRPRAPILAGPVTVRPSRPDPTTSGASSAGGR